MKQIYHFLTAVICFSTACAQGVGEYDPTFGIAQSGRVQTYFGGTEDIASVYYQYNGNQFVAGSTVKNGNADFAYAKLQGWGLDSKPANRIIDFGGQDYATAMTVAPSDRLFVVGYSTNGSITKCAMSRHYIYGSIDTSFGIDGIKTFSFGGTDDRLYAAAQQGDGFIVLAGYTGNGTNKNFAICRMNVWGQLDTSFGNGGIVTTDMGGNDAIKAIKITNDGRIFAVGSSITGLNSDFAVAVYNHNGTLSTAFNSTGKMVTSLSAGNDYATHVLVEGTKILVAGSAHNGSNMDFALLKLSLAGVAETGFGNEGKLLLPIGSGNDELGGIIQLSNTYIISGTTFNGTTNDFALCKLDASTGAFTTAFGTNGKTVVSLSNGNDTCLGLGRLSDGNLVVGGGAFNGQDNDFVFAEFTSSGEHNTGLGVHGAALSDFAISESQCFDMVVLPDNKIVLAGQAKVDGGDWQCAIAKYNANGSPDQTFSGDGQIIIPLSTGIDYIFSLAAAGNGKLVGGGKKNDNPVMMRFNADGTLDTTFSGDGVVENLPIINELIYAVKVLSDNKILALGKKSSGSGQGVSLLKFNENGTLDTAFGINGVVQMPPFANYTPGRSILLQPDGKIIVGIGGGSIKEVIAFRFNANGTLDPSFGSGTGYVNVTVTGPSSSVMSMELQPDGKILMGCRTGNSRATIFRFTTTGALDTTFGTGGKFVLTSEEMSSIGKIVLQPDGKILFCASFSDADSAVIFRVNANGTYDNDYGLQTYDIGYVEPLNEIFSAGIINGKVLIAVTIIDDIGLSMGMARIYPGAMLSAGDFTKDGGKFFVYPNPVTDNVTVRLSSGSPAIRSAELYDLNGRKIDTLQKNADISGDEQRYLLPVNLNPGTYILVLNSADGKAGIKIVK